MTRVHATLLTICVLLALPASEGGVFYDEDANTIIVADFPRKLPCSLERLLQLDKLYGWGKVSHDKAADTYTVACDLAIGANDGTNTYFQIGSPQHPNETLVMKGDLRVAPYWVRDENLGTYQTAPRRVNRLTLGDPESRKVRAALKFDCETKNQHGLSVGALDAWGGQLHVYDSTITAARPDAAHSFGDAARGSVSLHGDSIIFDNATYGWVSGKMTYGLSEHPSRTIRIVNTTFEHSGQAIVGGKLDLVDCTFRHLGTAFLDWGSIDINATRCTFADNSRNFSLRFSRKGIVCVDCEIGRPADGDEYHSQTTASMGTKRFPTFASKRHTIVEVVDAVGRGVPAAEVVVKSEQGDAGAAENYRQLTDDKGRTPGRAEGRAILLTEVLRKNTDTPSVPEVREFSYTVEVSAAGFGPVTVKGVRPTRSWQVVMVRLLR